LCLKEEIRAVLHQAAEQECAVPTYVYETIPQSDGEAPVRFEVRQGMNDPKLTEQPETGIPVRRLVSGGIGLLRGPLPASGGSVGSVTDPSWHQRD
jgi:predicted nucleic acid-binding Zn ribbon protein